jgi:hypothetical protein
MVKKARGAATSLGSSLTVYQEMISLPVATVRTLFKEALSVMRPIPLRCNLAGGSTYKVASYVTLSCST